MLAQRRQHRANRRPSLDIGRSAPGRGGDRTALGSHNLLSVNDDPRCPDSAHFPSGRAVSGDGVRRLVDQTQSNDRRDKPPPARAKGRDVIWKLRPLSHRRRTDEVALPRHRRDRRVVARCLLNCAGNNEVQELERFVVKEFLLRLPSYFSTVAECTQTASRCQDIFPK